jgi:UDP-N-acetylmuramoyl-L-alanyl-D-glutamate--2,6-diaminopimelate ligase
MANIASELSDMVIVTSDNPRFEQPEAIIDEVMTGIRSGPDVIRQADRHSAVTLALQKANRNDIVLIAGKGHEEYQIIKDKKYPFSDKHIVQEYIREKS